MSPAATWPRRAAGSGTRQQQAAGPAAVLAARRRALQVALGAAWLLDAALQFQPYMFSRAFVRDVILSTVPGNPAVIARPMTWSAGLMLRHIAIWNAAFAATQLLLAAGLLWRPAVKAALAASIAWSLGVWWVGEGLGGVLAGTASPVTGAPGAVILYAFLALLAWPSDRGPSDRGPSDRGPSERGPEDRASVASSGRLGAAVPRVLWAGLWGSLAYFAIQPGDSSPGGLSSVLSGSEAGEPGWIRAVDSGLARALAARGTPVSITIAAVCALAAVTVAAGRLDRIGVAAAALSGAVIWVAEDFGGIFTGQGTDPNSGLLLIVLAAAFWPVRWRAAVRHPKGDLTYRRTALHR
jgi:hypothetical protein